MRTRLVEGPDKNCRLNMNAPFAYGFLTEGDFFSARMARPWQVALTFGSLANRWSTARCRGSRWANEGARTSLRGGRFDAILAEFLQQLVQTTMVLDQVQQVLLCAVERRVHVKPPQNPLKRTGSPKRAKAPAHRHIDPRPGAQCQQRQRRGRGALIITGRGALIITDKVHWLVFIKARITGSVDPRCMLPAAKRTRVYGQPRDTVRFAVCF